MVKKQRLSVILLMALVLIGACSSAPAAPATVAPVTAAPAAASRAPTLPPTNAPTPTQPPTSAPAIDRSPLQPGPAVSPLQPGTGVSPLQPPGAGLYSPPPTDTCEALRKSVGDTLKANAELETQGFRDYATGASGQGCAITVRGTGVQFGNVVQVAQQLEKLLAGQGWKVDPAYAADSPTGTLFGLRKDNQLALVDVGWIATADVKCPPDQPISACDIKPEQQNFVITVNVAQAR